MSTIGNALAVAPFAVFGAYVLRSEARHFCERRRQRAIRAREQWDAWATRESSLHAEPVGDLLADDFRAWCETFGCEDADGFAVELADIRALPCAEPTRELRP